MCMYNVNFYTFVYLAREKIVGWYHTGPKLHQNDVAINELVRRYCPNSVRPCSYHICFAKCMYQDLCDFCLILKFPTLLIQSFRYMGYSANFN